MSNENIQELKFQVGEAWKGVYSSSTAYGLANVVQDPTGLSIYRSLKSGNVGHPVTDTSWWFCIIDMSSIKEESDRIAALNEAIAQDEALRVAAEELRQQHEAARIAAETQRDEAEQARISAEQARVNAESARATAEQQRITAEQGRVSAESARVQAEQARALSETLRANAEDQRAANEQNRIAAEQQRIERAEQDHDRAESDHAALQVYFDSLGAFDISSYHATDGVLAKYADLAAALGTNGANIPEDIRKGGMSVKFVQSSDNKYVQYRLMSDEFTTNTTQWAISDEGVYVENPEFAEVHTDADDKVLYGVKQDGDFYFGAGVPSQVQEELDDKADLADLDEVSAEVAEFAANKVDKEEGKSLIDSEFADVQSHTDSPEFLEVTTDSEGKVLAGRTTDGAAFEKVGFITPKVSINGHIIENIEDPEGRSEITTDSEGKIISYRDANGVKHENGGINTKTLSAENLNLSEEGIKSLRNNLNIDHNASIKKYHLPKYGVVNVLQETFYLTADSRYSDLGGVYLIQDYPDTDETAHEAKTLSYFYIKSTLINNGDGTYSKHNDGAEGHDVKLDFYAAAKVTKIEDKYYAISSLVELSLIDNKYYITSTLVDGQPTEESIEVASSDVTELGGVLFQESSIIEVTQLTDIPPYKAWPVDKKTEHYCIANVDFGYFYSKTNIVISLKYQGSSTLLYRKRNFRLTFYKSNAKPYIPYGDSKLGKKDKVKIGEMIRLSGYNLKANYTDYTRLKEQTLYNVIMAIWEDRPLYDQYPWNIDAVVPYTGATGTIKGFPVRLEFGGNFYGLHIFGVKKDEANYLLDGDESGIFVSGNGGWSIDNWEDEMNDEMSESTRIALSAFMSFISSDNFTRANILSKMSVRDWIDYFICLQVFYMLDNASRNVILYSKSDKEKFYPFFYDLDLSWRFESDAEITYDIITENRWGMNLTRPWGDFKDAYWDEIMNRYAKLRDSILTVDYIQDVFNSIYENIPSEDIILETRWGSSAYPDASFKNLLNQLDTRLKWLDEEYFKI